MYIFVFLKGFSKDFFKFFEKYFGILSWEIGRGFRSTAQQHGGERTSL